MAKAPLIQSKIPHNHYSAMTITIQQSTSKQLHIPVHYEGAKNETVGRNEPFLRFSVKIRNEGENLLANLFSSKSWGVLSAKRSKSHFSFSLSFSLVHTNTQTKCTPIFITLFHGLFMISGNCRDC